MPTEPAALVLDTNVVLDLLVFADPTTAALRAHLRKPGVQWLATQAMREELARVLAYPALIAHLSTARLAATQVLAAFDECTRLVSDAPTAPCSCSDPDDQKFIDLAVAHHALLLSRDRAVLRLARRLGPLGAQVRTTLQDCS